MYLGIRVVGGLVHLALIDPVLLLAREADELASPRRSGAGASRRVLGARSHNSTLANALFNLDVSASAQVTGILSPDWLDMSLIG